MRAAVSFSILLLYILILGVAEPVRVPRETENITVEVIDTSGQLHKLKGISCNGKSYLRVKKGSVEYSIALKSLKEVNVERKKGSLVTVSVVMRDGLKDTFNVSASTVCMSESKLGEATFYIKNVKRIILKHGERR